MRSIFLIVLMVGVSRQLCDMEKGNFVGENLLSECCDNCVRWCFGSVKWCKNKCWVSYKHNYYFLFRCLCLCVYVFVLECDVCCMLVCVCCVCVFGVFISLNLFPTEMQLMFTSNYDNPSDWTIIDRPEEPFNMPWKPPLSKQTFSFICTARSLESLHMAILDKSLPCHLAKILLTGPSGSCPNVICSAYDTHTHIHMTDTYTHKQTHT